MTLVSFLDRGLITGQKVRVYKNPDKELFTVKDFLSDRVVGYADCITLCDVHFQIRVSGQRACKETGRHMVHAYAIGTFVDTNKRAASNWDEFTYNPFQHDSFVDRTTGYPLWRAAKVHITKGKQFYLI